MFRPQLSTHIICRVLCVTALIEAEHNSTLLGEGLIYTITLNFPPLLNTKTREREEASRTPPFPFDGAWPNLQLGMAFVMACDCHFYSLFASLSRGVTRANLNISWHFAV